MAACRETGTPDLANHLSAADPLTRPNQIACGVVEVSTRTPSTLPWLRKSRLP